MRSFDVATFLAYGAAQMAVAGSDVLMEFDHPEIYAPIDLQVGKCRLAVACQTNLAEDDDPKSWSHLLRRNPGSTRHVYIARIVSQYDH